MKRKNILITSAGRRVELLQAFKEQLNTLLPGATVHATDARPALSAACQIADYHSASPRADDPGYSAFLSNYCQEHEIGMVVPTIDTELMTLAKLKDSFEKAGTKLVISSPDFIDKCRDKRKSGYLFREIGIEYPKIYSLDSLHFPCFAKPYNGSSSIGARIVETDKDLNASELTDDNLMFMELIGKEFKEYTVDTYFDRNGNFKCAVPRLRIEVRGGEMSKGATRRHALFDKLSAGLKNWRGAMGCITVQVFFNEETEEVVGLEVNPRFGGGFPLSYAAGANFPGWLIREYFLDEAIESWNDWEQDVLMLRYDAGVVIKNA